MKKTVVMGGLMGLVLTGSVAWTLLDKPETRKVIDIPTPTLEAEETQITDSPLETVVSASDVINENNESEEAEVIPYTEEEIAEQYAKLMRDTDDLFRDLRNLGMDTDLIDLNVPGEPLEPLLDPSLAETDDGLYRLLTQGNIADVVDTLKNLEIVESDAYLQYLLDGDYSSAFIELIKSGNFSKAAMIGELLGIDYHHLDVIKRANRHLDEIHLLKKRYTPPDQDRFANGLKSDRIWMFRKIYKDHPEFAQHFANDFENMNSSQLARIFGLVDEDDPFIDAYKTNLNRAIDEDGISALRDSSNHGYPAHDLLTKENYIKYIKARIRELDTGVPTYPYTVGVFNTFLNKLEESPYEEAHRIAERALHKLVVHIERAVDNSGDNTYQLYEIFEERPYLTPQVKRESLKKIVEAYITHSSEYATSGIDGTSDFPFAEEMVVHHKLDIVEAYLNLDMWAEAQEILNEVYELPIKYFKMFAPNSVPDVVNETFPDFSAEVEVRFEAAQSEWEKED
jgi:hypothetical protein